MGKVLVTGIGLVTAIGQDRKTTWANLLQGKTGIKLAAIAGMTVPVARVADRDCDSLCAQPRAQRLIAQAVKEAIAEANLSLPLPDCAVVIGSSRACQKEWEEILANPSLHPPSILHLLPSSISSSVAGLIQTTKPVLAPMAACATGNWAIAQAYDLIQRGECDIAIAGAVDAAITPLSVAGFQRLGAMAKTGLYPFSHEREGMVLGEGAAVLILESENSARDRGQPSYGQVLGFGITNDAYHPTSPDPNHVQAEVAVRSCLARAGLTPQDIDLICAHGTATSSNDVAEAALIERLFPHHPAIAATKGATGHALGATGMIEAAFCLISLQQQVVPPCIGLRSPASNLNLIHQPQPASLNFALNFSFGFGGQNAICAFGTL
jgi:3-oxoacyl-[acyl-carrier-protein] synthase II